jgi:hypothetical protein
MKQFFLTLLCVAGFTGYSSARTLTAVNSGDWSTASTWSPAVVPTDNDTVIVPQGKTVNITGNQNMNNEYLLLRVMGCLDFVGGGAKLKVSSLSAVLVYPGGEISTNSNSQVLAIGSNTVLSGSSTGSTITGPLMATASSTGFQNFTFNTLPVRYVAFTATRRSNDVLVQWTTAQEINAFSFEVEMSQDGRSWSKLAGLKAAGTTNYEQNYSYTARNTPAANIQFRVKQIDLDGKFMYTAARIVKSAGEAGDIRINAAAGRVVLQFGQEVKGAVVRIMSLNGQVLQEQKVAGSLGQVLIPTSQKGLCLVAVVTENEVAAAQKVLL